MSELSAKRLADARLVAAYEAGTYSNPLVYAAARMSVQQHALDLVRNDSVFDVYLEQTA